MKKLRYLNLLVLFIICVLCFLTARLFYTQEPTPVPVSNDTELSAKPIDDFAFNDTQKRAYRLYDFKDKTVLLHFWASWCLPCLKEFPSLLDFLSTQENVVLIAVSVDTDKAAMQQFLDRFPQHKTLKNMIIVADPKKAIAYDRFGVWRYPETLVIGPDHRLVRRVAGAISWDSQALTPDP